MSDQMLDAVRTGDRKALSRAISQVEAGGILAPTELPAVPVVGITGPPGAGKSTLISSLLTEMRRRGEKVAVLAVDPSSPLTGGALLGDRIRMQAHVDDPGVYVRSMATRGQLGGLARAAGDAVRLMKTAGFDWVLVETVGVGQSEVEVMNLADHVVLIVGPGWGDQIQADKAGVLEIADVIVVNKGDRPGVAEVKKALTETADARGASILVTTATTGEGVEELVEVLSQLVAA